MSELEKRRKAKISDLSIDNYITEEHAKAENETLVASEEEIEL